jgi:hypothetical protein
MSRSSGSIPGLCRPAENDGNYDPHEPVVEPGEHRIEPSDAGYQALLDRVGGLEPRHFRGISKGNGAGRSLVRTGLSLITPDLQGK